jgi:hypothetical protein
MLDFGVTQWVIRITTIHARFWYNLIAVSDHNKPIIVIQITHQITPKYSMAYCDLDHPSSYTKI